MTFWIIALSFVVVAVLWLSISWKPTASTNQALAIYRDQLAEVDRDVARGVLAPDDAAAAKLEINRRILREGQWAQEAAFVGQSGMLMVAAIAIPIAAFVLYDRIGSPDTPSSVFAERSEERAQQASIEALAARVRTRLDENSGEGTPSDWLLLGQTYFKMTRYEDASYALGKIVDLPQVPAGIVMLYVEALVASSDGVIGPKASSYIDEALSLNPLNPSAWLYRAIAFEQAGDLTKAREVLIDRVSDASPEAPWIDAFLNQINRLSELSGDEAVTRAQILKPERGPDANDVAAADMTPEERQDFIQSMVKRLADRLKAEPGDVDGWLRLARAQSVLGDTEAARNALRNAEILVVSAPESDPMRQRVAAEIQKLGLN
ncbi:MAG: cytochrome c-type biogenesis protein CcmH [Yoonia sp.]|jgi:cytochrome c-type biogenesis protein CcmH